MSKIPLSKCFVNPEVEEAALRAIRSGQYILGKESQEFEKELAAHAGTEEMLAAVRSDAKQRQIDRMLVERRVPIAEPPRAPSSVAWIWLLAGVTLVGLLFAIVSPMYLPLIIIFAVVLFFLLHRVLS